MHFSSTEKAKTLTELVIFVTPIVVDNPDENDVNFNEQDLERLDDLSRPLDQISKDLVDGAFFDAMKREPDETEGDFGDETSPGDPCGPEDPKEE